MLESGRALAKVNKHNSHSKKSLTFLTGSRRSAHLSLPSGASLPSSAWHCHCSLTEQSRRDSLRLWSWPTSMDFLHLGFAPEVSHFSMNFCSPRSSGGSDSGQRAAYSCWLRRLHPALPRALVKLSGCRLPSPASKAADAHPTPPLFHYSLLLASQMPT